MEPTGTSRLRCLILTVVVAALALPAVGAAIPSIDWEGVRTTNAVTAKKAPKAVRKTPKVCTRAQAAARAKGKRVNCVTRPRVCTAAQAKAKAKGKKVNCVTRKVAKKAVAAKTSQAPSTETLVTPSSNPPAATSLDTQSISPIALALVNAPALAPAVGCSPTLLNFEGSDGDFVPSATGTNCLDWTTVDPVRTINDVVTNGVDQSTFVRGAKDYESLAVLRSKVEPGQVSNSTDIYRSYTHLDQSSPLFALGLVRAPGPGTSAYSVEFNQNDATRSSGDVLFVFDFPDNSLPIITRYTWLTANDGLSGTCEAPNRRPCWGARTVLDSTQAIAGSNTTPVQDPFTGETLPYRTFNELALDLSKALPPIEAGTCKNFGSMWVRSRNGGDINSSLTDSLDPQPISIANCKPQIVKSVHSITGPDGASIPVTTPQPPIPAGSTVTYDIAVSLQSGSSPIRQDLITVTDSSTSGGITNQQLVLIQKAGGDQDNLLEAGETWYYGLSVGPPPVRVSQTADECSLDNTARLAVTGITVAKPTSTVTTPVACGTLVIKKVTDPASTPSTLKFGFTPGTRPGGGIFELGNGETKTYTNLLAGTDYAIAETGTAANWSLKSATCTVAGVQVGGALNGQNLTGIEVRSDAVTTCVFTNKRDQAQFNIGKTYEGPANLGPETYRVNYECRIGGAVVASGQVSVGPNATSANITVDTTAECTITEVAPAAVPGHTWTTTYPTRTVTIATGTTPTAVVKNVLTRDTGSLSIAKTLQNPDDASVQATFAVTYTCTMQGQTTITGTVNVAPGTPQTVSGIPTGYTCSIVETAPTPVAGHTWDAPTYSPSSITVNAKGGTFTLGVTNRITRDRGSLSIAKTLQNPDGASVQATFAVTYTCTLDGQPPITGTVNVAPGTPETVSGIPTGYSCSVVETAPTPVAGYTWDEATYSTQPVTVTRDGQQIGITVTNRITRDRGSLSIEKTLQNPDDASVQATFAVTYTCTLDGQPPITGTVNVTPGTPQVINGIPTGSTCTISETAPTPVAGHTWDAPTYSPPSITVNAKDKTFTLGVTNRITRDRGSLSITKTLQNPDDASVQATFAVTYTCTLDGQPPITGKVDVAPGTPRVINGIPTGYACSIVETAPTPVAGYTWDEATYSTQPVTVTRDGQQIGITVTNRITRDRGSLSIEKTLQNPDDASVQATFAVTYTCRMDGQPPITGTVNVAPGTPQVINGIPTGSTCTISETAPTPVAGHTWDAPTYSPPSITVNKKGETFTLGVTNRITRDRGSLAIEKTLVNPNDATVQETFAVTYTCTMQGAENVTGTVNVAPGTPEVVSGIPTGYTCTITETAPTPVTGFTWADPTYDPESIVIGIKGKTFTLGVTNTIAREMGSLVLSKTLTGGPAGYTGPFSIGYTCTFPGSEPLSGTVELAADQTSDPVDVPSGYVCSATETLPAAPAGHTFGTPQIGAPVTIANRTRSEIAVANTLTRDTGSLVVAKTLTGGPAGYTGPFPVAYSCTMAGAETITGTREVSAGGSVTIDGIPTGYSCSVTEELPTAPANHVFATPVISGAVSITKDATATVTVANRLQVIDVAIAKVVTNGAASYRPGDVIVYAITVTNTGEATVPVSAIQITDPDITGLTLVQPAPAAIAPGEWVTYTGTRVVTEAMRGQTVPNTARVTVPGDDNPNNNTATATFPVEMRVIVGQPTPLPAPARARLSIDKSGAKRAKVGDDVVYTIRVKNTSPNVATGVIVSDVIPTGMTLVGVPTLTPTQARVNTLTRSLAAARLAARRATGRAKVRATARVRTLTRALATARAADRAARAKGQPISATILRGIVRWNVGDMKPGQVVTFQVTMRAGGTKTVDRCNTADAIAGNADRVSDRQCTRFAQVAGARVIPKVTG